MKQAFVLLVALSFLAVNLAAQDLIVSNARIVDANRDIDIGHIVVRDGRIESVAAGAAAPASGVVWIDARGRTAMPGFIDGHRHIMSGDDEAWFREESVDRMREYLEAGFTTLMSGGGPVPGIVELQRRIESGELAGPRIVTSGRATAIGTPPEAARAQVRESAQAGVEIIKSSLEITPTAAETETLAAIVDEARRHGLEVMVHAVSVPSMIAAVEAGAAKLVHTPTRDPVEATDGARFVRDAGVSMTSTLGIWVPIYGEDNAPLWRDGTPFPPEAVARAGQGPVNGRHLWDAGVVYGFGTDTRFLPRESLAHELLPLRLVFSNEDIVRLMGPNTAAFIDMEDEIGTLAPGKLADIVLIEGDPLNDISSLLDVVLVIKSGAVAIDRR